MVCWWSTWRYAPHKGFSRTQSHKSFSTKKQGICQKLVTHKDRNLSENFRGTLRSAVEALDCALLQKGLDDFTAKLLEMTELDSTSVSKIMYFNGCIINRIKYNRDCQPQILDLLTHAANPPAQINQMIKINRKQSHISSQLQYINIDLLMSYAH